MLNTINRFRGRTLLQVIAQRKSELFWPNYGFLFCDTSLFVMLQCRGHNHLLDYMAITSITLCCDWPPLTKAFNWSSSHKWADELHRPRLRLWSNHNCICLQWRLSLVPSCLLLSESFSGGGHAQTTELGLAGWDGLIHTKLSVCIVMYHCNFNIQRITWNNMTNGLQPCLWLFEAVKRHQHINMLMFSGYNV